MVGEPVGEGAADDVELVHPHLSGLVAFHRGLQIALGVQHDAFVVAVVIEGQLAGMLRLAEAQRTRHHPRVVDVFRQLIRRRVVAVINDTRHHRAIEIAVDIGHQHFLADARHGDHAPAFPRPGLHHADPARAVLLGGFVAIPVEMHADARKFVGMHFGVGRADHGGALDARHLRLWRFAQRAERHVVIQRIETAGDVAAVAAAVRAVLHEHIVAAGQFKAAVAVGVRVQNQGEILAGHQPDGVTLAKQQMAVALHFLKAQPRQVFTAFGIHITRRVVVPFQRGVLQAEAALFHLGLQVLARVLEVEVAQHDFIRAHFTGTLDALDPFADGAVFFAVRHERQHGVTEIQIVEILPVGDHQRVFILGVIEVIPDAFVFKQAADKREIRFGKLHAIFTRRIGAFNIQTVVGKTVAREDLLDDVEHVQILKNAAVAVLHQKPQPGAQLQLINELILMLPRIGGADHVSVKRPRAEIRPFYLNADPLTQQRFIINVRLFTFEFERILRVARQPFFGGEAEWKRI